jgi:hypothetical protein
MGMEMPVAGTTTHRSHGCDLGGLLGQGGQHIVSTEAIVARSGAAKPTAARAGAGGPLASGNKGVVKLLTLFA